MVLDQNKILAELAMHAEQLEQRFQVKQIGLFGSYVHQTETNNSDIDILVDFIIPTFDNYMNLKFYLEDLFDRDVDLVMRDSLKPRLRPYILQEVQYAQRL